MSNLEKYKRGHIIMTLIFTVLLLITYSVINLLTNTNGEINLITIVVYLFIVIYLTLLLPIIFKIVSYDRYMRIVTFIRFYFTKPVSKVDTLDRIELNTLITIKALRLAIIYFIIIVAFSMLSIGTVIDIGDINNLDSYQAMGISFMSFGYITILLNALSILAILVFRKDIKRERTYLKRVNLVQTRIS